MSIYSLVPDPESLVALEPEELAGVILEDLHAAKEYAPGRFHPTNMASSSEVRQYPREYHTRIKRVLMEGWAWLVAQGLIARDPDQGPEFVFITRKGEQFKAAVDLRAYREAARLPQALLHAKIAQKVWGLFLRSDYDTAVFHAFKELEVAVRAACDYPPEFVGEKLMRKAFDSEDGCLRDSSLPDGERNAEAHLFAGAMGRFKNPHSHRNVALADPSEAYEMLMLASHLMRIVDTRLVSEAVVSGTP